MGFSTLLQSVSGFFSRAFWFSRFLPVVVIALVHETLGRLLFGWNFTGGFASILDDDMGKALPTFAGLVVLAYALGPTIPLIRSLLDGSVMPEWLHNWLREDRRAAWDKARRRPGSAFAAHAGMKAKRDQWASALEAAAADGIRAGTATNPGAISAASAALDALKPDEATMPVDLAAAIDEAGKALAAALASNSSNLVGNALSDRLDDLHGRFRKLLDEQVAEATHQAVAAPKRLEITDPKDFQPTRFGDARHMIQRYATKTYHVPFEYLWPRVRLAIISGEDDNGTGTPRIVADAVAQVDFAVFLFALWWTVPLAWLPAIVGNYHLTKAPAGIDSLNFAIWAFLAIGLATPLIAKGLYQLAIQAEIVAASATATALDRYRRDALKELGFEPPVRLSEERLLWSKLYRASQPKVDLIYPRQAAEGQ